MKLFHHLGGVKFLGGGINEGCEHESCQSFCERLIVLDKEI
jgi:hypothetical protein